MEAHKLPILSQKTTCQHHVNWSQSSLPGTIKSSCQHQVNLSRSTQLVIIKSTCLAFACALHHDQCLTCCAG
eukprot:6398172-Amphidinium_carterae.1